MTRPLTPEQIYYAACVQAYLAVGLTPEQRAKRGEVMQQALLATLENRHAREQGRTA